MNTTTPRAEWLLRETERHDGMAPVDLERFWADQAVAAADPFGTDIPQVPLGIMMNGECVYDELGIPEDYWRYENDVAWRLELNKAYNDRSEKIVGRRLLPEDLQPPANQSEALARTGNRAPASSTAAPLRYPPVKGLHDLFEARNVWHDRSWWLMESAHDEDELKAVLDRVDQRLENLRAFLLPADWDERKAQLMPQGIRPSLYRWQRGPCTFATSIYGPENFLMLAMDNPDLTVRLRDTILKSMLAIAKLLDEEAGYTQATSPRGFGFADDNCALLNGELYELFGYPILKGMFDVYSPGPSDRRYQHSDSSMGHLLPFFGKLGMTGVNFGPKLTVTQIREHCPKAVIDGQLAPFTFSRDEKEGIVREALRDFDQARAKRGLRFATAGSINNGSRLTGMRLIMSAIQHFGRYS